MAYSCYLWEYIFVTFQGPVLIASTEGGVNIEEIAESNPDAIQTFPIDIIGGLSKDHALEIAGKDLALFGKKPNWKDCSLRPRICLNYYLSFPQKTRSKVLRS